MSLLKRRHGFEGEKLISLPDSIINNTIKSNTVLSQLYVRHIGYFPKASYHFRLRRNGCPDNILIYCLRGRGWYEIKNRKFKVGINEFFIIPATREPFRYGADEDDPWTIYWIHFTGKDMDAFNRSFNIGLYDGPKEIIYNETGLQLWDMMYGALDMGFRKENIGTVNLCLYHFIATFLFPGQRLDEKKQDDKNMVNEAILYMRSRLDKQLSVQDFAIKYNLSKPHFTLLFRKSTGMSPLEYFIHLKLQKACLILYSTDTMIKNIAAAVGYDDQFYFSRLFKKYMKVSPEQYRLFRRKKI